MAQHLADSAAEPPSIIVGYSFGGALGFELLQRLPGAPRLIMVDSHLPRAEFRRTPAEQQFTRWLTTETRDWIALMEQLGRFGRR
ncbi:hypothetical protein GGER_21640 [Serratia rubidaea]